MSGEQDRYIRARRRRPWRARAGRSGARRGAVRLPIRRTDRVEDLVAWLLVSLGLLAGLGAVLVGAAARDAALGPGRLSAAAPVSVVLLADVPPAPAATQRFPSPLPRVPVSWTASDGVEQTGELGLRAPLSAGDEVTAWLDRDGRLSAAPPQHASEAMAVGVGAGLTTAAMAWALLSGMWSGVRRATTARNDAAWAREWARVEPVWSRQVH
jgi:hypothetical protein